MVIPFYPSNKCGKVAWKLFYHYFVKIEFNNTYVKLPERFYSRQLPNPVSDSKLVAVNHALADHLGIYPVWLESEEGVNVIAGNQLVDGAELIATVYAGHQFGHLTGPAAR